MRTKILVLIFLMTGAGAMSEPGGKETIRYDSKKIISELSAKRNAYKSFGQTYQVDGTNIKRMYFRFEPQYTYRSECLLANSKIVKIFNVDGKYDFVFEKDGSTAFRAPTTTSKDAGTTAAARRFHGISKGTVVGEESFKGESCYLVDVDKVQICVSKRTGLELIQKGSIDFVDIVTDLPDAIFQVPSGRKIIDIDNISKAPFPTSKFCS